MGDVLYFMDGIIVDHAVFILLFLLASVLISVVTREMSNFVRVIFTVTLFGGYYYLQMLHPNLMQDGIQYITQFEFGALPVIEI
jgi:hypothetical protein